MYNPTHISVSTPTVNDDYASGFRGGNYWFDTVLSEWFFLSDSTTGAAVWDEISGSAVNAWDDWTPGFSWTGTTVAGVAFVARYIRLGDIVYFTVMVSGTTAVSANQLTTVRMTLPATYAIINNNKVPVDCYADVSGTILHKGYIAHINTDGVVDPPDIAHATFSNIAGSTSFTLYYAGFYETE